MVSQRSTHLRNHPFRASFFDDPIVREELALYYTSVRRADDAVGAILDALKKSGENENTIVFFLSDHGMPLPFAKTQLYHHSTRTPLIVRWPGVVQPETVDDRHMVSAIDFLPTFCDMVHAPHPDELQGTSFLPLLQGKDQKGRQSFSRNTMKMLVEIATQCAELNHQNTSICLIRGQMAKTSCEQPRRAQKHTNA